MTKRQTLVSTPGKVLVTGGYLVLEEKPGLVISLNSRFCIQVSESDCLDQNVEISSPQFENGLWIITAAGLLMYILNTDPKLRLA
jgi:phosphomevalonate kinase